MRCKENVFIILKIVLFAPFFFGTSICLFQSIQMIRFLSAKNHYVATSFIKQGEYSSGGRSPSRFVFGYINNCRVEVTKSRLEQIRKSQIGDTIYIWYIKDKIGIPRPHDEKEFRVLDYAYSNNRLLMILGIPPFLLLLVIESIMKRKKRNLVQKIKFRKR